jgi:hypothetical protein
MPQYVWRMLKKPIFLATALSFLFVASSSALAMGSRKPCVDSEFVNPFDADQVSSASLAALHTFREAIFRAQDEPASGSPVEYSRAYVMYWSQDIEHNLAWIAENIKKHPATARCSSKFSADSLEVALSRLKTWYQPTFYRYETARIFNDSIAQMESILPSYKVKQ